MTLDPRFPQRPLLTDLCRRRPKTRGRGAAPVSSASPGEIALAIRASGLARVVVVSVSPDEAFHGGGVLSRALLETGVRPVLIDLLADGQAARELGLAENLVGLADVASGRAMVAEALHRDPFTAVHVVPSAGFDPSAASAAQATRAAFALSALSLGYEVSVVECTAAALVQAPTLLDAQSGLVVSGSGAAMARMSALLRQLEAKGFSDGVAMRVSSVAGVS